MALSNTEQRRNTRNQSLSTLFVDRIQYTVLSSPNTGTARTVQGEFSNISRRYQLCRYKYLTRALLVAMRGTEADTN